MSVAKAGEIAGMMQTAGIFVGAGLLAIQAARFKVKTQRSNREQARSHKGGRRLDLLDQQLNLLLTLSLAQLRMRVERRPLRVRAGFVQGFGIRHGAMASTVAHDAHNLMVVGSNDADMALAANTLLQSEGGMCVVRDGQVLGHVALPVAGLMSEQPAEEMAALVDEIARLLDRSPATVRSQLMRGRDRLRVLLEEG